MELYKNLGEETRYHEYKEAVLSTPDTISTMEDFEALRSGHLTSEYYEKIIQQIFYDMYRYIPRYVACFFNSVRKRAYSWYYGVTDEGFVTGIPVMASDIGRLREELHQMFSFLMSNHLAIVISSEDLEQHIKADQCQEQHHEIYYLSQIDTSPLSDSSTGHDSEFSDSKATWLKGYTCLSLKRQIKRLVQFQMIPLIQVTTPPSFLLNLESDLIENSRGLENYRTAKKNYEKEYAKWLEDINYYSSKIDTMLNNPKIIEAFKVFTKDFYYEPEHLCTKEEFGKCFRVGDQLIRNPPFLTLFREFRDYHRNQIRSKRPRLSKAPKDLRVVVGNRLTFSGWLLRDNPEVDYIMLRVSCRALELKTLYRAVFFNGKFWQYQSRRLRSGVPECGF